MSDENKKNINIDDQFNIKILNFDSKKDLNSFPNDSDIQKSIPLSLDIGIPEMDNSNIDNKLNDKKYNPLLINHSDNHNMIHLNMNKDNELLAMPSPFIKDGINLSSLYMNNLTSKQLEFTQQPSMQYM